MLKQYKFSEAIGEEPELVVQQDTQWNHLTNQIKVLLKEKKVRLYAIKILDSTRHIELVEANKVVLKQILADKLFIATGNNNIKFTIPKTIFKDFKREGELEIIVESKSKLNFHLYFA